MATGFMSGLRLEWVIKYVLAESYPVMTNGTHFAPIIFLVCFPPISTAQNWPPQRPVFLDVCRLAYLLFSQRRQKSLRHLRLP